MAGVRKIVYRIWRALALFLVRGHDEEVYARTVFINRIDGWFETYGLVQAVQAYYLFRHEGEEEDDNGRAG